MDNLVKTLTQVVLSNDKYYKPKLFPSRLREIIDEFTTTGFDKQDIIIDTTQNILKCLEFYKSQLNTIPTKAQITVQARQGGKDAQDLAQKLLQMYINFFKKCSINYNFVDISYAEVGIHQASILVQQEFGLIIALLLENGLHRVERYSPYNAQHKKQTSHIQIITNLMFPQTQIKLNQSDLEITPIKASGPGGQYVNKTLNGIMIKHIPTKIYVRSTQFRSQQANKKFALEILKSKLIERQLQETQKKSKSSTLTTLKPHNTTNIRTYDFIDNKIRNQYIKYKLPNTQKIILGNIEPLLMYNILYAIRKTCNKIV